MIVCPNCKHGNPEGATNCEACYTALPATKACPSCGASVQVNATFCGQCGHNLQTVTAQAPIALSTPEVTNPELANIGLPPTVLTIPEADVAMPSNNPVLTVSAETPAAVIVEPESQVLPIEKTEVPIVAQVIEPFPVTVLPLPQVEIETTPISTQLQTAAHQLLHLQTNTNIEIPPQLTIVHIGKPNDQTPPDIDVSGFPCAEVVSRIHANIRVEGESYYIEDIGSANGTYINHNILPKGNRHLLRSGDRIGLGKGDLVTFIFQ